MGAENPLLNFRCPQEVKDTLTLHAGREGREVGPMLRTWMVERLAVERTLEVLKSVGLQEVLRRLSVPSAFMTHDTAPGARRLEQTSENVVRHDADRALQGTANVTRVLHGKHVKRG